MSLQRMLPVTSHQNKHQLAQRLVCWLATALRATLPLPMDVTKHPLVACMHYLPAASLLTCLLRFGQTSASQSANVARSRGSMLTVTCRG